MMRMRVGDMTVHGGGASAVGRGHVPFVWFLDLTGNQTGSVGTGAVIDL